MLAIRLSRPYTTLSPVIDKIYDVSEQCIVYEHQADANVSRTHVHILVDSLSVSPETIKNWLRFDGVTSYTWNKTDWSFKKQYKNKLGKIVLVDADMITYMAKGTLKPCRVPKGFPMWHDAIKLWIEPRKYQTTLDPKEEGSGKITQWEMFEEIEKRLKYDEKGNLSRDYSPDRVIEAIIHVHLFHHKLLSRYKVRDFYDTFMSRNNRSHMVAVFSNLISKT